MSKSITRFSEVKEILDKAQRDVQEIIKQPVTLYFKIDVRVVTREDIIREICIYFKLSWSEILSTKREPNIIAKQIFCWLARLYTNQGVRQLAVVINASHAAVVDSTDKVREMIEIRDAEYLAALNEIETQLIKLKR